MNDFVGDQFSFISALTEENIVPFSKLPTNFFVDFGTSSSSKIKKFENFSEIKEENQRTKTGNDTFENMFHSQPNEPEILFSPDSIPFSLSPEIIFNDPQLSTDQQFSCNRKRDHSKIEQPKDLVPQKNQLTNLSLIKIKKETDSNLKIQLIPTLDISPKTNINTNTITNTNTNNSNNINTTSISKMNLNNYSNKDKLSVDEIVLVGDFTRSQLKYLTKKQKKKRKILKNRISAAKCYTKIKQKITNLDQKVSNLKETKKFLSNKIDLAKNERKMLLSRQDELKNEIKQLLKSGNEIGERTGLVIESLCDNLYNFGQIPVKENETTETPSLPKTTKDTVKLEKKKKKTRNNNNNKAGFTMMAIIIAISLVFANELLFGSSTNHSNTFISKQTIFKKRSLSALPNNVNTLNKDKFTNNHIIWIKEIDDTDTTKNKNENEKTDSKSQPFSLHPFNENINHKDFDMSKEHLLKKKPS
ncbi:basic leucine-zipper 70-related [Anaeramoeba flamelloides]|uniref:Basic leucine-zipper 70-related n=1 Tax=Anaeramoeba flamelloides TaxID=1746091 RepID=A0ABQ8YV11_9EUKA|nr:basic leucine-zipper 70-related [Anaeramoeba flamelloides]